MSIWQVHALKYATRSDRTRAESFILASDQDAPHPIDYFVWLLRAEDGRMILVDTGYDAPEALLRGRPVRFDAVHALAPLGIAPEDIDTVIVTHLHYDHAGGLHLFPNARLHMQVAEMAYATGPCMCHGILTIPFTAEHVCEAVRRVFAGRVTFHDGDGEVADGVTVHRIGGHSRGLQAVRVRTEAGWLVLASDATHFYENLHKRSPFPLVVDVEAMLEGFATLERLASSPGLIVPGHDPLVTELFPRDGPEHVFRLDRGPIRDIAL